MHWPNLAARGMCILFAGYRNAPTKRHSEALADYEGADSWLTEQANPTDAKGISVPTSRGGRVRATVPFAPGHAANESAFAQSARPINFRECRTACPGLVQSRAADCRTERLAKEHGTGLRLSWRGRLATKHSASPVWRFAVKAHARCLEQLRASRREARKLVHRCRRRPRPQRPTVPV